MSSPQLRQRFARSPDVSITELAGPHVEHVVRELRALGWISEADIEAYKRRPN
jgi:hypothetical protein